MSIIELILSKFFIKKFCSDYCHESNGRLWSSIWLL